MKKLGLISHGYDDNGESAYYLDGQLIKLDYHKINGISFNKFLIRIKGDNYPITTRIQRGEYTDEGSVYKYEVTHLCILMFVPLIGNQPMSIQRVLDETSIKNIMLLEKE